MKKVLVLVTIAFAFISFRVALENFDDQVVLDTIDIYDYHSNDIGFNNDEYVVAATTLSFDVPYDLYDHFTESFLALLDKYDLNAYQFNSNNYQTIIFAYSDDATYIDKIKSYNHIEQLKDFSSYTSYDEVNTLLKPINDGTIEIYSIKDNYNNSLFSYSRNIYITANDTDSGDNIANLIEAIEISYPDINIVVNSFDMHYTPESSINSSVLYLFALTAVLLILIINTGYLKNIKVIVLKHINGFSHIDIFYQYFVVPDLLTVAVIASVYLGLLVFNFQTDFALISALISSLGQYLVIMAAMLLIISVLTYISIAMIDKNIIIKGYRRLRPQLAYTYALRILTVILCFPFLISGTVALGTYITSSIHESSYLASINDLYYLDTVNSGILNFQTSTAYYEAESEIRDQLNNQNAAFDFIFSGNLPSAGVYLFTVDKAYIENMGLTDLVSEESNVLNILIPVGYNNTDEIEDYIENNLYILNDSFNYEYYDQKIINYATIASFANNDLEQAILIYSPERNGLNSYTYFYYADADAKAYIDDLFKQTGFRNPYRVSNLRESYLFWREFEITDIINDISFMWISLTIIIIMMIQSLYLYMLCNGKQMSIMKVEGWCSGEILATVIGYDAVIFIISAIFLILANGFTLMQIIQVLGPLLLITAIIEILYFKLRFAHIYRRYLK